MASQTHFLSRDWFECQCGRRNVWGCLNSGVGMRCFRQSHRVILLTVPLVYLGEGGSNLTRVSWTTERWDCKKTPCHRSDCLILSLAGLGTDQCLSEICDQSHWTSILTVVLHSDSGRSSFAKLQHVKGTWENQWYFRKRWVCFTCVDCCYFLQLQLSSTNGDNRRQRNHVLC